MNSIGEKIRALRKAKKMTLDVLAGDQLSKGMLSLIENGKAQPSMESLHYIADRLQVDVASLLQEERIENIKEILVEAEKLLAEYGKTFYEPTIRQQFLALIEPIHSKLQKNTYEEIRLLDIYARFQMSNQLEFEDDTYREFSMLYKQVHAYDRMIYSYNMLTWKYFYAMQYEESLKVLKEIEQMLEVHYWHINDLTRLDFYYNMMVISTALFDYETTDHYYKKALSLSKEKRISFKLDDIYRMQFALHIGDGQVEQAAHFLRKIESMMAFMEDSMTTGFYYICKAHYYNFALQQYDAALQTLEEMQQVAQQLGESVEVTIVNNEKVYAYYMLGRYEEALALAKQNNVPFYVNHPLDLVQFYLNSAIRASCYAKVGNYEEAKRDILYAMESIKKYKPSQFTRKIEAIYAQLKQQIPHLQ